MALVICPADVCHKRKKGFSMKMLKLKKNARVTNETMVTQGKNSRSRSHLRNVTAEAKADINQDQKISEPACPPHRAVMRRYSGMLLLVTEETYLTSKLPLT